ncbi:nucleotide exchange factor GrpE [Candidatus Gribaldobacteria bacterium]|nr:nucleotide exchange factor GrpE [Candidatus Gribaldobacteria bacterium]
MNKEQHTRQKEAKKNEEKTEDICQEYLNGWKRCLADFENFKKNEIERLQKARWQSKADVCLVIIKTLENFQRMNQCLPDEICQNEWVKGVLMVENQLITTLQDIGLEEIKALNQEFNPEFHEAVSLEATKEEEGKQTSVEQPRFLETVIEIIEKGWLLDNKVLKPAKVRVKK